MSCDSQPDAPALVDPSGGQFGLTAGSPNVNAGLYIPGINDGYDGTAPDIGYIEQGRAEVPVLVP